MRKQPAEDTQTSTDFKLAEPRADGTLVLQTEDGRMFVAKLAEGVEPDVIKSSTITIAHEGIEDGVPTNPVVTKIDR